MSVEKAVTEKTIDNGNSQRALELRWNLFVLYVDLYKHHLDLFVKGYLIHLAIIGTAAGFVFRQDTDPRTRVALIVLAIFVSITGTVAWTTSFLWATAFGVRVQTLCCELDIPNLPMFGVKVVLLMATLASAVFTVGGVYVLLL